MTNFGSEEHANYDNLNLIYYLPNYHTAPPKHEVITYQLK